MTSRLRDLARRLGVVMVVPLFMGSALVASAASAEAAYTPTAATVAAYEARVIARINYQRLKYKRSQILLSVCTDGYAERWAAYLGRTGYFKHQSLTPILSGCGTSLVGETIARGYPTADLTVDGWMASPGHRAIILDGRFTRIGVAAVYAGGRWTVVADYVRPR